MAALLGVLVFDTLPGLFIGIAVSCCCCSTGPPRPHIAVLGRIRGAIRPVRRLERHPENEAVPGIVILRVDERAVLRKCRRPAQAVLSEGASADIQEVVLDAETVPFLDATAAKMLGEVASELSAQGVRLVLAHSIGDVRHLLRETEASSIRVYPTVQAAVDAYAG